MADAKEQQNTSVTISATFSFAVHKENVHKLMLNATTLACNEVTGVKYEQNPRLKSTKKLSDPRTDARSGLL